nr:hypothetical protein [Pandoravirus aubagnensis]
MSNNSKLCLLGARSVRRHWTCPCRLLCARKWGKKDTRMGALETAIDLFMTFFWSPFKKCTISGEGAAFLCACVLAPSAEKRSVRTQVAAFSRRNKENAQHVVARAVRPFRHSQRPAADSTVRARR